jgi:hypothetical protein
MTTLQEYADAQLDKAGLPQLKQPLKTLPEAFAAHGWGHPRKPTAENKGVVVHAAGPVAIEYYEPATGKFVMDVTGPFVDNGVAPEDVAGPEETSFENGTAERSTIAGVRAVNAQGDDPIKAALQSDAVIKKFQKWANDMIMGGVAEAIAASMSDQPRVLH